MPCDSHGKCQKLARPKRFELLTPRFVVWCSDEVLGCVGFDGLTLSPCYQPNTPKRSRVCTNTAINRKLRRDFWSEIFSAHLFCAETLPACPASPRGARCSQGMATCPKEQLATHRTVVSSAALTARNAVYLVREPKDTPVGTYNPDWTIVKHGDETAALRTAVPAELASLMTAPFSWPSGAALKGAAEEAGSSVTERGCTRGFRPYQTCACPSQAFSLASKPSLQSRG